MSTILGSPLSIGGGGAKSGLNVFVQETQPTAQNGLWIKKAKNAVTGVNIDNELRGANFSDVVLPGTYENLDSSINRTTTLPIVIKIGNIIYASPAPIGYDVSSKGKFIKYDIENGVYSLDEYSVSGIKSLEITAFNVVHLDGIVYFISSNDKYLYKLDYINKEISRYSSSMVSPATTYNVLGSCIHGTIVYTVFGRNNYDTRVCAYDLSTNTRTTIKYDLPAKFYSYYGKPIIIGNKLYFFAGSTYLCFVLDLDTKDVTYPEKYVVDGIYNNKSSSYQSAYATISIGSVVYFIGLNSAGTTTTTTPADSTFFYNVVTGENGKLDSILSSNQPMWMAQSSFAVPGWFFDGASVFVVSGFYRHDTTFGHYQNIVKVIITSNDLPSGTVWAHESISENVTEMYRDKTMKLNLGIDKVLIQEADGLKVQPAAIIKNGVATDIGGGVIPEPTPLPELAGTWVLNDRLYAPESSINMFSINGSVLDTTNETYTFTALAVSTTDFQMKLASGSVTNFYVFRNNTWNSRYQHKITFPAGATAPDEFRAWLASNATKQ